MALPKHLLVSLVVMPLMAVAAPGWQVAQPYQDNPLKTAVLSGRAEYDGVQAVATLTVVCRPDAGRPSARLSIDQVLAERFPVDHFEGPGGVGEKARLVEVGLAGRALIRSYYSSGSYQKNAIFEWTFTPQSADFQRWMTAKGATMSVRVTSSIRRSSRLLAQFQLPDDSQPLRDVIAPCLKKYR